MSPLAVWVLACGPGGGTGTPSDHRPPHDTSTTASTGSTGGSTSAATGGTGAPAHSGTAPSWPPCGPLDRVVHWVGAAAVARLAVAPDDSLYVAGALGPALTLGSEPGAPTLDGTCGAFYNGLLVHADEDGAPLWARTAIGCGIASVDVESSGARVAWLTRPDDRTPATFQGGGRPDVLVNPSGLSEGVMAEYDATGDLLWVGTMAGAGSTWPLDSAIAPDGSVFVVGTYRDDAVTIGPGANTITLQPTPPDDPTNDDDGFLAKWNPDGTLAWAQAIRGRGDKNPTNVALEADGSIIVGGSYTVQITLASNTAQETTLDGFDASSGRDGFVAKFAPDGVLVWAQRWGDVRMTNDTEGLATDPTGAWGIGTVGTGSVFGAAGDPWPVDDFSFALVRWGLSGSVTSVRSVASDLGRAVFSLDARPDGWLAVGGSTGQALTFGAPPNTVSLPATRGSPMVLTWRPDGSEACTWPIVSDYPDFYQSAVSARFDHQGGLWSTGQFADDLVFAQGSPQEVTLHDEGVDGQDLWLAHFLLDPPAATP